MLENEECLYNTKTSHAREGEFFQPKNPELIEKFQSTHEYIKKMYEHSKSKAEIKIKHGTFFEKVTDNLIDHNI